MPSTDRKLELKAKTSMAQTASQAAVYAKGLNAKKNLDNHFPVDRLQSAQLRFTCTDSRSQLFLPHSGNLVSTHVLKAYENLQFGSTHSLLPNQMEVVTSIPWPLYSLRKHLPVPVAYPGIFWGGGEGVQQI
jgi:hypothetical protein